MITAINRFNDYFSDILLDEISNRNLSRWVEYERQRGIKDITIRLWSRQFNKICRNAKRLGYYTPVYEWCEWNIKDKPIRYLTDNEEQRILKELDPSSVKDPYHKKSRQAARDIFILMVDGGFRINEASIMQWSDTLLHLRNASTLTLGERECFFEKEGSAPGDGAHIEVHARRGWLPCQLATATCSHPCDKLFNWVYQTPISAALFVVLTLNSHHS